MVRSQIERLTIEEIMKKVKRGFSHLSTHLQGQRYQVGFSLLKSCPHLHRQFNFVCGRLGM